MGNINKIEVQIPGIEEREADLARLESFTPDEKSGLQATWAMAWGEGGDMYAIALQNAEVKRRFDFTRWGIEQGIFDELIVKSQGNE